jgi:hypothetical protein
MVNVSSSFVSMYHVVSLKVKKLLVSFVGCVLALEITLTNASHSSSENGLVAIAEVLSVSNIAKNAKA